MYNCAAGYHAAERYVRTWREMFWWNDGWIEILTRASIRKDLSLSTDLCVPPFAGTCMGIPTPTHTRTHLYTLDADRASNIYALEI